MPPRPRLDLSGTPGLQAIGLSPVSWQTSLHFVVCPDILHKSQFVLYNVKPVLAATKQLNEWSCPSARPPVCPCKMSRSEANGQGRRGQSPIQPFPDCYSSFNSHMEMKWRTKLNVAQKRCPILSFKVIRQISSSHGKKHHHFLPKLGISGL